MFKKTLATAAVICAVPALASASWFLSTQANNAGGTVTTAINGVTNSQDWSKGAVFNTYTTSAGVSVTVTPDDGYVISGYNNNGDRKGVEARDAKGNPLAPLKLGTTTFTIDGDNTTDKNFSATFTPLMYNVTAKMAGGSVTPAGVGNLYKNYELYSPLTFTFTPNPGYQIQTITGIPENVTQPTLPAAVGISVKVTFPKGYKFGAGFNMEANATKAVTSINPILPQTVVAGSDVTLSATGINTGSYTWTYVSGPADQTMDEKGNPLVYTDSSGRLSSATGTSYKVIPGPAIDAFPVTGSSVRFTAPQTPGQYKFLVTNGAYSNLAVVNVYATKAKMGENLCQFCHTANGIGSPTLASDWSKTLHATNNVDCATCHVNSDNGGHPGFVASTGCESCHRTLGNTPGGVAFAEYTASGHHANAHGPATCSACHTNAHSPVANAFKACVACHNGNYSRDIDGFNHYANTPNAAFSNISASGFVGYKGQGINVCSNCHFDVDAHGIGAATTQTFTTNSAILTAWAESAHGDRFGLAWTPGPTHDWRNSGSTVNFQTVIPASDCVRCHTSDGFVQFAASNFSKVSRVGASDANRYNSPLSCNACHATDANGFATATRIAAVKTAGSVGIATFYNVSTVDKTSKVTMKSRIAANFPDVGESNLCISCHSGRVAGPNLAALAATGNWDLANSSFQNSHYMAASGTMYMKAGFKNFTTLTAPAPQNTEGSAFTNVNSKGISMTYEQTLSADAATTPDGVATGGQSSAHRKLGTPAILGTEDYLKNLPAGSTPISTNGPCVTCHMKAYDPIAGNGFNPPAAGRPAAGHSLKIDEATAQELCLQCHADAPHLDGGDGHGNALYTTMTTLADMEKAMMEPQSECLQNGLTLIKKLLEIKYKIKYDPLSYPYFYDLQKDATGKTQVGDWTRKDVAGVTNAADVADLDTANVTAIPAGGLTQIQAYRLMGACFNLNLLARDPGAYLHARTYSQRLVYDTVDFLDNNQMDFTPLNTARAMTAAGVSGLAGVYVGNNVNVFASDGTLATESMAWLSGTHYADKDASKVSLEGTNTLMPMKLRP